MTPGEVDHQQRDRNTEELRAPAENVAHITHLRA